MKLVSTSFLVWVMAYCPLSFAEEPIQNPVVVEPVTQSVLLKLNELSAIKINMQLPEGYHGYLDSLRLEVLNYKQVQIQNFQASPTIEFFDKFTKRTRKGFEGHFELELKIMPAEKLDVPHGDLVAQITYQACTDQFCLLPAKKQFKIPFAASEIAKSDSILFDYDRIKDQNIIFQLALIFLVGFLTSLTPCIFPMIPITLSILGTRAIDQPRHKNFLMSVTYVFGIATTYSAFGYAAAKTGTLFGNALSKPLVVLFIAAVFYVMALSMFGFFEVQIPLSMQNRLNKIKLSKGFAGAFIYGLIAGVVASPCVGPVLVSLLAHVAQTNNTLLGVIFLFTYALGLGVIFIVLGTLEHLLVRLPKAGPWMNITKFIFGCSMILMALYYIHNVFSERIFLGFASASVILVTGLYGALDPVDKILGWKKYRKWAMAAFFCLASGLLFKSVFGQWVEPTIDKSLSLWKPYSEIKLEEALAQGHPVILDFAAEWCVACHELDKFTFSDQQVKNHLEKFVLLKIDATTENDEISKTISKFKVIGLPTLIFYGSNGKVNTSKTLTGYEPAAQFLKRIEGL